MAYNQPTTETTATVIQPQLDAAATEDSVSEAGQQKWPGWPGYNVYRLLVPATKVGSIIGKKGYRINKLCEETGARVRVLDAPITSSHRIVLVSGKEDPEVDLSPAMDAVMRLSKQLNGLPESDEDDNESSGVAAVVFCAVRLLVAAAQAITLIGKQGARIKSIQESSGATIQVLSDEVAAYASSDERIVELQGEAVKVIKALESVVGHLRKFLVDHSVLPLFEKSHKSTSISQDRQVGNWAYKATLYPERNQDLLPSLSGSTDYGHGTSRSGISSSGRGAIITQVAQTMQIPLTYADAIIGVGGSNIAYIRSISGAVLTVKESMGLLDEITLEIKGTSSEVQVALKLIQECVNMRKEVIPRNYGNAETGTRSSYSQLKNSFPPTSLGPGGHQQGLQYPYGSSGLGGYSSYRM